MSVSCLVSYTVNNVSFESMMNLKESNLREFAEYLHNTAKKEKPDKEFVNPLQFVKTALKLQEANSYF